MNRPQAWSARTVYWLLAVGVLSFAGAAWFMIYAESDVGVEKANAFSYSAIGHRALVESLREIGIPVLVSRDRSAEKAGDSSLLVIAEPRLKNWYDATIGAEAAPGSVLLVLPKWDGLRSGIRPHWLGIAGMIPRRYVESVLREVVGDGTVLRVTGPMEWDTGPLMPNPEITYPQLIESGALRPVIHSDQGILLGRLRRHDQTIWVLSDPDLLSNHGLATGGNGVLALRMIDFLRPSDGAVVFDETVHGYWQPPNLWRNLLQLPFIVPVILALAAIAIAGWSAAGRFGSPLPPGPPFLQGKELLIDNTASLLRLGGYGPEILRRYAEVTLRDVARRLNAPRRLEEDGLIDWVDRVGAARGVEQRFKDLRARIARIDVASRSGSARIAALARRLYKWREEITDGS